MRHALRGGRRSELAMLWYRYFHNSNHGCVNEALTTPRKAAPTANFQEVTLRIGVVRRSAFTSILSGFARSRGARVHARKYLRNFFQDAPPYA